MICYTAPNFDLADPRGSSSSNFSKLVQAFLVFEFKVPSARAIFASCGELIRFDNDRFSSFSGVPF